MSAESLRELRTVGCVPAVSNLVSAAVILIRWRDREDFEKWVPPASVPTGSQLIVTPRTSSSRRFRVSNHHRCFSKAGGKYGFDSRASSRLSSMKDVIAADLECQWSETQLLPKRLRNGHQKMWSGVDHASASRVFIADVV